MSALVFDVAAEQVFAREGGLSDHRDDRGGLTKFGISRRAYPQLDIAALTREQAKEILWRDYWLRLGLGRLPGTTIPVKVFDLGVNVGTKTVTRLLQRALRAAACRVVEDGLLGPQTVDAVRRVPTDILLAALRSEAAGHYRLIAARDPSQEAFLAGWLARAYA